MVTVGLCTDAERMMYGYMERKIRPGDTVYIVENNNHIRECQILKISGGFAVVAFSRDSATRLWLDRLFADRKEAENHIRKHR